MRARMAVLMAWAAFQMRVVVSAVGKLKGVMLEAGNWWSMEVMRMRRVSLVEGLAVGLRYGRRLTGVLLVKPIPGSRSTCVAKVARQRAWISAVMEVSCARHSLSSVSTTS